MDNSLENNRLKVDRSRRSFPWRNLRDEWTTLDTKWEDLHSPSVYSYSIFGEKLIECDVKWNSQAFFIVQSKLKRRVEVRSKQDVTKSMMTRASWRISRCARQSTKLAQNYARLRCRLRRLRCLRRRRWHYYCVVCAHSIRDNNNKRIIDTYVLVQRTPHN